MKLGWRLAASVFLVAAWCSPYGCGANVIQTTVDGNAEAGATGGAGGLAARFALPCASDKACTTSGQLCDPTRNVCVVCLTDTECGGNARCVAGACQSFASCHNSLDCPADQVCDASGRCVECATNADCGATRVCAGSTCRIRCTTDKNCTDLGLLCDPVLSYCVECRDDSDCGALTHCDAGICASDVCDPLSTLCVDVNVFTCEEHGTGYSATSCPVRCSEVGGAHCEAGGAGGMGGAGGTGGMGGVEATAGNGGAGAGGPLLTFGMTKKGDHQVGATPWGIAAADLNGDKKLDLVTANLDGNNASVLLGNGDGTFGSASNYNTDSGSLYVAVDDFNTDTHPDLAVSNGATVSVLLGNGNGTFQPATNSTIPWSGEVLALDVNRDANADMVVANGQANGVTVFLGDGKGSFQSSFFPTTQSPENVAAGDLNGDAKLDLVTGGVDVVDVLIGNGDGTFQLPKSTTTAFGSAGVSIADFNRDGKLDVANSEVDPSTLSILLGNGNGTLGTPVPYPTGALSGHHVVGDLNLDGKLDLVEQNQGNNDFGVLLGNGDGTFQNAKMFTTPTNPRALALGDFNRDGKPDVAVACFGTSVVSIFLNTSQ